MIKVKIIDNLFAHAKYSTDYQTSKYIEWDRNLLPDKICFYTDMQLKNVLNYNKLFKKNVAWLLESTEVTKPGYSWIRNNNIIFDHVLTYNKDFLDRGENFLFSPVGGCWIKPEDQKVYNKNKLISIIASGKRMTDGHRLRHDVISSIEMDVYGRGYTPVEYKLEALKDYMFTVVIENTKKDYYFTEKLIDSFMSGTIPIYYGCPSIGKFFNEKGIIIINSVDDMKQKMSSINEETYKNMLPYIKENFETAKKYLIAEDYIFENYKNKIF